MDMRTKPWQGPSDFRPCPVCKKSWRPWHGSRLPCHAKCYLTDAGVDLLAALWRTQMTIAGIAATLEVPNSVINASLQNRLGIRRKQ